MNIKGQLDYPIITFIIILIGLFIIAPVFLKVFIEIQTPFSAGLGNVSNGSGIVAQQNFNAVMDTAVTFWDKIIIFVFFLALILMFVTAFLIDAHPFFLILYIVMSFLTIITGVPAIEGVTAIYDEPAYTAEVAQLTFMDSLRANIGLFLVGIMVITGIIIFGKLVLFTKEGRK